MEGKAEKSSTAAVCKALQMLPREKVLGYVRHAITLPSGGVRISGPCSMVHASSDGYGASGAAAIPPRTYFVQSPTRCATSSSFDAWPSVTTSISIL